MAKRGRAKASQSDQPAAPEIRVADKARFTVTEVAELFAAAVGCSQGAARVRIYRAIDDGRVSSVRFLGSLRVPRSEVCRILQVEDNQPCGL